MLQHHTISLGKYCCYLHRGFKVHNKSALMSDSESGLPVKPYSHQQHVESTCRKLQFERQDVVVAVFGDKLATNFRPFDNVQPACWFDMSLVWTGPKAAFTSSVSPHLTSPHLFSTDLISSSELSAPRQTTQYEGNEVSGDEVR